MCAPSSPPSPAGQDAVVCAFCHTPDRAPDRPCLPGLDHNVGWEAGCPACGWLKAVYAGWRVCSVRRCSFAPLRLAVLRLRLAWRARQKARPLVLRLSGAVLAVTGFDPSVPNTARVYNYWLGGKDDFHAVFRGAAG